MKTTPTLILCIAVICGCAPSEPLSVSAVQPTPTDKLIQEIKFHEERVLRDPKGAIGLAMLSEAYLALANAKDDDDAAVKAEEAARKSLDVREMGNYRAATRLTQALLHQHRFVDAEASAKKAMELGGGVRLYADVLLELGKYDEFKKVIAKDLRLSETPEGAATLARWNEVIGQPERSIALLEGAVERVKAAGDAQREAAAWFQTQLGWTYLRAGKLDKADNSFHDAMESAPTARKAYAGMARLAFEKSDWDQTVAYCEKSNEIAPLTDVLGWQAMALRKLGREQEVQAVLKQMDALNQVDGSHVDDHKHDHKHDHKNGGSDSRHTHNRLYANFLADFGRNLRSAHHMAEEDLQWRKDIHAYDAFAWATYKFWKLDPEAKKEEGDGLLREAVVAIKKATATGTLDPTILAHAKEILTEDLGR